MMFYDCWRQLFHRVSLSFFSVHIIRVPETRVDAKCDANAAIKTQREKLFTGNKNSSLNFLVAE